MYLSYILKQASSAKGIPERHNYGDISMLPLNTLLPYVLQRHKARRAGLHNDLRFGRHGLFSWAIPKAQMPLPGEKKLAVRTELHSPEYANFEGKIGKGYGSGTVSTDDKGSVYVTKVTPTQINFVLAHKEKPEHYTLVKAKNGVRNWILINNTKQEGA